MIHPHEFSKLFNNLKGNEETLQEEQKTDLMRNINVHITGFCEQLSQFMREKYLKVFIESAKEELTGYKFKSVN